MGNSTALAAGCQAGEVGAAVETLFRGPIKEYGAAFAQLVMDGDGHLTTPHTRVLVNGKDLFLLNDMQTVLRGSDVVSMILVTAG